KIVGETMIKDYHFYEILTVRRGRQKLREKEIKYGRYLLRENSETFRQCWQIKLEKLQKIKDGLTAGHPDINKIDEEIKEIKAVLQAR
ncbi:MAG: tRNA (adenine(22)-N(1))-methyltransferase TrmK, partial [Erysipelotrichaceae bacterium]|nr:tRNA (adenine(22)-N(1))-methyltransferase TrmK [Erysipelotrichaceae bacterium]